MIAIIDYGSGNLRSVYNAFKHIGEDVKVTETRADLDEAERIVLPGVGSSKDAMEGLTERGLIEPLIKNIAGGKPFLGICLGLQLLLEKSEESGGCDCLSFAQGEVKLFPGSKTLKVPAIGWNTVKFSKGECPIFRGIKDESFFYFVHSYYCCVKNEEYIAGSTEYGLRYTSAFWKDNVFAVQFHPERSQAEGIKILENFSKL